MISSLWIAKTGLDAQQTNMDAVSYTHLADDPAGVNCLLGGFDWPDCSESVGSWLLFPPGH